MTPKIRVLVILLSIMCIVATIVSAVFGYLYFKEKGDFIRYKGVTGSVREDEKIPTNEEEVDEDVIALDDGYYLKKIRCVDDSTTAVNMNIVYSQKVDIEFENINNECRDIEIMVGDSKILLTYSLGEVVMESFGEGVEVVSLKKGLLGESGMEYTLGRQKYVQRRPVTSNMPAGFYLEYVSLRAEDECGEVAFPCYMGGHPFLTSGGLFQLYLPPTKSPTDILDIVNIFDDIAKRSYYEVVVE